MKAGDRVKLIGIPPDTNDDDQLQTRSLFEKCLGRTFVVAEIDKVEGLPQALARIDVGQVVGEESSLHTIWIEEEYLEVQK